MRSALLLLNSAASQLWTAKCDAWTSSAEEGAEPFDPYEMDAEPGETAFGAGSYIDLLPRDFALLSSFERQERWIRAVTEGASRHTGKRGAGGTCPAACAGRRRAGVWSDLVRRRLRRDRAARRSRRGAEALDLALPVIMDVRLM